MAVGTALAIGSAIASLAPAAISWMKSRNQTEDDKYDRVGSADDVININDRTDAQFDRLRGQYSTSMDDLRRQMAQQGQFSGQAAGLLGQLQSQGGQFDQDIQGLLSQLTNFNSSAEFDPDAANRQFLSQAPQLQQLARESFAQTPSDERLRNMENQLARRVGDQFSGNPNSGAFTSSVAEAMLQPRFQMEQQRRQNIAGLQNQLLGTAQQQASQNMFRDYQAQRQGEQDYLNQLRTGVQGFQGERQALMERLLQGVQGFQGLGQQAMQGASLFGDLAQGAQQGLTGLSAPEYWQPNYQGNPDYITQSQLNNQLAAGIGSASGALSGIPQGGGG